MKGTWNIRLLDEEGNLKEERIKENIITSAGLQHAAQAITGQAGSNSAITRMRIGSGSAEPTISDTNLAQTLGNDTPVNTTYTYDFNNPGVFTLTGKFGAHTGSSWEVREAVCQARASNTIFNRVVFPVINKGLNDELEILVSIDLSE